jgi:hypothetical protein
VKVILKYRSCHPSNGVIQQDDFLPFFKHPGNLLFSITDGFILTVPVMLQVNTTVILSLTFFTAEGGEFLKIMQ